MDGPAHCRQAEQLLSMAAKTESRQLAGDCQLAAQVHATLALAAATALNDPTAGQPDDSYTEWRHAAAVGGRCGNPACSCRSETLPAVRSLRP